MTENKMSYEVYKGLMLFKEKYEQHQKDHPGCEESECLMKCAEDIPGTEQFPGKTFIGIKSSTLKFMEDTIEYLGGSASDLRELREEEEKRTKQEIIEKSIEAMPTFKKLFDQHKKDHSRWYECPQECLDKTIESFPGNTYKEKEYAKDITLEFIRNEMRAGRSKEDYLTRKAAGTLWE